MGSATNKIETKIKTACFILCRMSSSRLPGKALKKIRGRTIIGHIIDRAKLMSRADTIVLCTSIDKNDDIIESIARDNNINFFRGSLNDLLERFLGAALKFKVDHFAVYTADNIFCEPELMDLGLKTIVDEKLDFINLPSGLIVGGASYCISTEALIKVCQSKKNDDTEYYPQYFTTNPEFKIADLKVADPLFYNQNIRATIDYPEDLEFARKVFDEFNTDINIISLRRIVELINRKPEIAHINLFRQKDWSHKQKIQKSKQEIEKRKTGPEGSRSAH